MFFILQTDPIEAAEFLSNPYSWGGALLLALMTAVVMLWRQLIAERRENKKEMEKERTQNKEDFKSQLTLLTKVELHLLSQNDVRQILIEIKSAVDDIKGKIQ